MTITSIKLCNFKVEQLESENAELREQLEAAQKDADQLCAELENEREEAARFELAYQDECVYRDDAERQLAAAQATIANMRDSVAQMGFDVSAFGITNLDALHEDRARTLLALLPDGGIDANDGIAVSVILHEATKHRARKEGK